MQVQIHDWNIGPAHDPYSASLITLKKDDISCECYNDGLGRDWVQVLKGDVVIVRREWNFFQTSPLQRRLNTLYSNLLARRYVGKRFDEAESEYYENYNPRNCSSYYA